MTATGWQLLSYALHLASLILWLGSMVFFLVVFAPAVNQLEAGAAVRALDHGRRRLEALGWAGIGALVITGVANLMWAPTSEPGAGEFYVIGFAIKMILFGAMIYHQALQAFKYGPAIAAMTRATPEGALSWPEPLRAQWQKWLTLLKINATLGPVATVMGLVLLKS